MSAAGQPNYSQFSVFKKRRPFTMDAYLEGPADSYEVDIKGKIVGFNYYESLYSPMVTASFVEVDTGGTVGDVEDNFAGTFKDGLRIEGFERVKLKVLTSYNSIDWTKDDRQFVITGSPYNTDEGNKQVAYFPMVSVNAITSASKPVKRIYKEAKISDIVKKILRDSGLPFDKNNIEETENKMKVDGNNENPLDVILKLCPKAKPVNGDPGYFFFENHDGFNFKSIHGMIFNGVERFRDAGPNEKDYLTTNLERNVTLIPNAERSYYQGLRHTYVYKTGLKANLDNSMNDFNVLTPPTVRRDQDVMNAIKNGQFNVRICTRNLATGEVKEKIVNLYNDTSATLGSKPTDNLDNNQTSEGDNNQNYCKTYTYVINPGENEGGDNLLTEGVPFETSLYHPKAIMRYQLLHAQLVNILVPHNAELTVGEVIRLNIENITQDEKIIKEFNQHRSGYYLILHLCHSFSTSNSFTSLTLVRDQYGISKKLGGLT